MPGPYESDPQLEALIRGSLSSKSEVNYFLGNTAHRLRSTLTVMRIYTELIQSGIYGNIEGDLLEKVAGIGSSIDEISGFIDSMQDLSTASNLPVDMCMKRSDLYAITYDVMKGFTSQQSARIRLTLSSSPVVEALADEFIARKALGHLISYTLSGSEHETPNIELMVDIGDDGPAVVLVSAIEPMGMAEMESLVRSILGDSSALSVQDWKRFSLPMAIFFGNRIGSRLRISKKDDMTWEYRMVFGRP
jgi:signal transduction histidine kinase